MKNHIKKQVNKAEGTISISSKGTGYVAVGIGKDKERDPEIDFKHLNTALHGDMVEIILHPKNKKRQTAEVSKIITRAKTRFAGILEQENGIFFLKPDDTKMYTDILIPKENLNGAKIGQKVFDSELPKKVEDEARRIKQDGIINTDYAGRRDFRKTLTFTIDPSDAKDFDDAISFKEVVNGEYEIGIHIADVSHYVKVGSALDIEARERGTSVYLVDRTIPMLPEILSNDLCSLIPHKDRLAMSAVFVVNKNAQVKSEWFGRTVIHSQKRFTYEEAEISIKKENPPLHRELTILNNLAKRLTA